MKRILKLLVRLYPAAWRERYGAEFEALLEDRVPSAADAFDVLLWAVKMHSWSFVGTVLASCLFGVLAALAITLALPPRYVSQAVVMEYRYDGSAFVPLSPDAIQDQFHAAVNGIQSSESLAHLVQKYDLYPRERAAMPLNAVLNRMRSNIYILPVQPGENTGRIGGYAIQFRYADAHTAQKVDSELAHHFQTNHSRAGEQFVLLSTPTLPQEPSFPDRRSFGASGLLAGLVLGLISSVVIRSRRNQTTANG